MIGSEAMHQWNLLGKLAIQVFEAALVAFGGLGVVLEPLQRAVVALGLISLSDFARLYALSSVLPGPNGPIFMALVGWPGFGLIGSLTVVAAWAFPSLLITHQLGRISAAGEHPRAARLLSVLKAIAVGLIFDGVLALLSSFNVAMPKETALQMSITLVGVVLLLAFKLNPLWLLLGAMALGAALH